MIMRDVLFTNDTCQSCHVVIDAVRNARNVNLMVLNIDRDPVARHQFIQTGSTAVPTAVVNNVPVVGSYNILAALRQKYGAVL